ncbi:MAG TPA: glucosamine-6-phosphate deaminase [Spirochaetia bacterium]|nr:glucosamine-6-phosphate deaminase [Spirochaetia bacterium]
MTEKPEYASIDSAVERFFLTRSVQKPRYDADEKLVVVVVDNFPDLGRLSALRFIEWVAENPEGVVSLPTGKTPEYFIREVRRIHSGWKEREIQRELEEVGLGGLQRPEFRGLRFVQIDEFYPMNPLHHNSFYFYVNTYYCEGFGLDPKKALFINCDQIGLPKDMRLSEVWSDDEVDLSLRYRSPRTAQEKIQSQVLANVDQWCCEYEDRIRQMGGIGFFLGGIGPDGHIGFNTRGSDLHSTTRLSAVNYETQAAAATDLGGIEVAKKKLVITIGLATITYNPCCTAIIMAAGEAKRAVVAGAVQSPKHILYPASILQVLPGARFYITRGAAKDLTERQCALLVRRQELAPEEIERILIDISLRSRKTLVRLSEEDFKTAPFGRLLLNRSGRRIPELTRWVSEGLKKRFEEGIVAQENRVFLHTEPHHDDIALGYLPFVVRHIRVWSNTHYFVTLTSGFNAVTNHFMLGKIRRLKRFIQSETFSTLVDEGYFDPRDPVSCNRDVWQYLDGVAAHSPSLSQEGEMRRLARDLMAVFDERDAQSLKNRTDELANYFETQYPGKKDLPYIQRLKGMCREWESDCLWGYFGWNAEFVHHLRLGFYKGDVFTEEPTLDRDVLPFLRVLRKTKPDVVTVAFDPEASGPDTHYKVMQTISEALRIYEEETGRHDIEVMGYRNVWYRFHPSEAKLFVPVSLMMFSLQHSAFLHTFISQRDASFPSHEHDGPFSELAQRIQVDQYQMLKTCLGRSYFHEHPQELVRATRGIVFLRPMSLGEFYAASRELRDSTERGSRG